MLEFAPPSLALRTTTSASFFFSFHTPRLTTPCSVTRTVDSLSWKLARLIRSALKASSTRFARPLETLPSTFVSGSPSSLSDLAHLLLLPSD